jgi:hypothetical protein
MKRIGAVFLVLVASACFDQFLVGPEPNVAPQFFVYVDVRHDEGVSGFIFGSLRPGTDQEGNGRTLVDSSMTVDGSAIQGTSTADRSRLTYTWTTQTLRDTIAVKGPTLGDQTSATATILVPTARRVDAAYRDIVLGQDIQFSFSPLGEAPYGFGSDQGFWRLEIEDERLNFPLLTLQGRSPPTSPIVIPSQLLPTILGDSLVATLTFNANLTSVLAAYPTFLTVATRLSWRMRMVAPAIVR